MTTVATLIGGPSAGKRFRIHHKSQTALRVPRPESMPVLHFGVNIPSMRTIVEDIYTPRFLRFEKEDKELVIYVHESLNDYEAQIEMLRGYVPVSAYDWEP